MLSDKMWMEVIQPAVRMPMAVPASASAVHAGALGTPRGGAGTPRGGAGTPRGGAGTPRGGGNGSSVHGPGSSGLVLVPPWLVVLEGFPRTDEQIGLLERHAGPITFTIVFTTRGAAGGGGAGAVPPMAAALVAHCGESEDVVYLDLGDEEEAVREMVAACDERCTED